MTDHGHRRQTICLRARSMASGLARVLVWAIVVYGGLLRFEAFHRSYGPVDGSPASTRAQERIATFVSGLRPASIEWPRAEMPYRFDAKSYLDSARAMRHFYEARLREPLFVFSTKVGLQLTGSQDIAVSLASSTFSALLVVATYALGRAIGGVGVGLASALLIAIEPQMIDSGIRGYRDDLFALLTVLFAWACVRLLRALSVRTVLLALTAAAACLTRITALTFVIPGLAATVAFCPPSRRHEAWRRVLAAGALSALLIAPFLFNCWVEFGDPLYSITWHSGFYGQRSGLDTTGGMTTTRFLQEEFDRAPLEVVDSVMRGFTHYPWANKWTELGRHWGWALDWGLRYLCLVGLLMWLWSAEGRLALVVLAGSMVPFVFTWEVHAQWRFTQHVYPFYTVAAACALAWPLQWAGALARDRRATSARLRLVLVRTSLSATAAATFLLVCALLPPLIVYRQLAKGQASSVGGDGRMVFFMPREAFFFGRGWSAPYVAGNATLRDVREGAAQMRVVLDSPKEYRCLLRIEPASDRAPLPRIELRVNGEAYPASTPDTSDGMPRYWATIPAGVAHRGLNRIDVAAIGTLGNGGDMPAVGGVHNAGFRFWYLRIFPGMP